MVEKKKEEKQCGREEKLSEILGLSEEREYNFLVLKKSFLFSYYFI